MSFILSLVRKLTYVLFRLMIYSIYDYLFHWEIKGLQQLQV